MQQRFQTTEYTVIYVVSRDSVPNALKIGKTSVDAYDVESLTPNCDEMIKATSDRLRDLNTYGVDDIHVLHTEVGYFVDKEGRKRSFWDTEVHEVLRNSHYVQHVFPNLDKQPTEWYEVTLDIAKKAIAAVKAEQEVIDGPVVTRTTPRAIHFRDEQTASIEDTIAHYTQGHKMLWNAKMRFGKTLCALELIRRQQYKRTLILTHRPTVRKGWFEDFHKLPFENYEYGSKNGQKYALMNEKDFKGLDFESLKNNAAEKGTNFIYFASMQDLRGSDRVADSGINKNDEVFSTDWDFIIFDEAHEGTQTPLGKKVVNELTSERNPFLLYLSGTPFNILSQFQAEEIFTWDYVMEQTAKTTWDEKHPGEVNPYEGLAKLNIYTYNIGEVFNQNAYVKTDEDFFSFAEFFRTWKGDKDLDGVEMPKSASKGDFVHASDVHEFLDMLCRKTPESYYPFSKDEFCRALSHTLWLLPGVAQANALQKMLSEHPICTEMGFHIVNVAGQGEALEKANVDDAKKIEKQTKDALEKVELAIRGNEEKGIPGHNRTITLSCGRLTTGVSIPEWTGVFMLSGGYRTSAASYMQTIFRCQTPFKNGAIKSNCYAFDFAPDRTLYVVDEWIGMRPDSGNDDRVHRNRREHTKDVESHLRFCPIIAMQGGREEEYNAISFVERVNAAAAEWISDHGWKGRRLVKDMSFFTEEMYDIIEGIGKVIAGSKGVAVSSSGEVVIADGDMKGDTWTCPSCGHTGNTTPTCDNCGAPRPKKQKGAKGEGKGAGKGNLPPRQPHELTPDERFRQAMEIVEKVMTRFPLLLFGAVENVDGLTLDELLDNVIDDEAWEQFMQPGLTKAMVKQMAPILRANNLIATTALDLKILKAADELPVEQRVLVIADKLGKYHFPDRETILTPWRVVNLHMSQTLGGYDFYDEYHSHALDNPRYVEVEEVTNNVFWDENTRLLEINSKSGVYPLYLAYSLYRIQCEMSSGVLTDAKKEDIWRHVLAENIFVLCKTEMAAKITRRVLAGYKPFVTHCKVYPDLLEKLQMKEDAEEKKQLYKDIQSTNFWDLKTDEETMKFNAVVGNPPYQKTVAKIATENGQKTRINIFHYFQQSGEKMGRYTSLIYPGARWIHRSGKGLKEFGLQQINDSHMKHLIFYPQASDIFKTASLADGISIVLKDMDKTSAIFEYSYVVDNRPFTSVREYPGEDLMPLNPSDTPIVKKIRYFVNKKNISYLHDSVLSRGLFGIESDFVEKNPKLVRLYSSGDEFDKKTEVKLLTNDKSGKAGRAHWYVVKKSEIKTGKEYLKKWKVIVSSANAGGQKRDNQIEILDTHSAFGRARVALKTFDTKKEAQNFLAYCKSELIRYAFLMTDESLTSLAKLVPDIEDYTDNNKFIDFSGDVNQQLYDMFDLREPNIEYIQKVLARMAGKAEESADDADDIQDLSDIVEDDSSTKVITVNVQGNFTANNSQIKRITATGQTTVEGDVVENGGTKIVKKSTEE